MTEAEFKLHSPDDYRSLSEFLAAHWGEDPDTDLSDWQLGFDIQPSPFEGVLFTAKSYGLCRICLLADGRSWVWEKDLGGPSNRIPPFWTGP